jgi:multidrug transporter EmrE-like cation transporter
MIQSLRLASSGLLFIAVTIAFTVTGQLLVKHGMLQVGRGPSDLAVLPRYLLSALTHPSVFLGLSCAVVAALSWTIAVSRSDLSVAYPFMGLAIVLVLGLSGLLFGESIILGQWVGTAVVVIGLVIAGSAR